LLLQARGEYARAEPFFRDALAMRQRLYPEGKYPDGHPELARSLNNLGALLLARGEYAQAEPFYHGALAMRQKLYPKGKYPDGHPDLAQSLNNLGFLLQALGDYAGAEPFLRDALAMRQCLAASFADASAEAESLNYRREVFLEETSSLFLSVTEIIERHSVEDTYAVIWQGGTRLRPRTPPAPPPPDR
jgi:tetratricopeptide (TPR) repeat protein